MIGSTILVKKNVPVGPGRCAAVEIIDHGITIALPERPALQAVKGEFLFTAFGKDQVLRREGLVDQLQVIKLHRTACPGLIPMEADATDVFGGARVFEDSAGLLVKQVPVMVPADQLFAAHTRFLQSRS